MSGVILVVSSSILSGLLVFVIQIVLEKKRKKKQYKNTLFLLLYEIYKINLSYQQIYEELEKIDNNDWLRSQPAPGMQPYIYFIPQVTELLVYKGFAFSSNIMDFYIFTNSIKSKLINYSKNLNEKILLQENNPNHPRIKDLEELLKLLTQCIKKDFDNFNNIYKSIEKLDEYKKTLNIET